jgi:uncharacterized membrane protein YhaH (DUF805 family)
VDGGPSAFDPAGSAPERSRGGCLTALLAAMIASNSLAAIVYFADPVAISQQTPSFPEELGLLLGLCAVLNAALAVMVLRWRRIGVYGLIATAALTFAVNLQVGVPLEMSLIGLAGPITLALLVWPRWKHFD